MAAAVCLKVDCLAETEAVADAMHVRPLAANQLRLPVVVNAKHLPAAANCLADCVLVVAVAAPATVVVRLHQPTAAAAKPLIADVVAIESL